MSLFSFLAQLFRDAGASQPPPKPAPPVPAVPAPSPIVASPMPQPAPPNPIAALSPAPLAIPDWLKICRPVTEHFESCQLIAYCDPESQMGNALQEAGLWYKYLANRVVATSPKFTNLDGRPWTVGFGATQNGIGRDTVWTQDQADSDLTRRLLAIGIAVDQLVTAELLPHQKAAIVDFAYNEGEGRLARSTMLKHLNARNFGDAMAELLEFDIAGGKKNQGLVNRRQAEKTLFTLGSWHP